MNCDLHMTVAALAERDGQFLMVEEQIDGALMLNQPAGHLEPGESLIEAVVRETLEETAWRFRPEALLGVYHADQPDGTWLRFAFVGSVHDFQADRALDEGIVAAPFLPLAEIRQRRAAHRSPFVEACLDDFLGGRRLPLDALRYFNVGRAD
ncbi:MAG: NUDIX hydrolase [Halothiobacillaceae bacterium]